MPDTVFIVIMH